MLKKISFMNRNLEKFGIIEYKIANELEAIFGRQNSIPGDP